MAEKKPYILERRHGYGYMMWSRQKKKQDRKCLGFLRDPRYAGDWVVQKNGQVIGSGRLLSEAATLLWNASRGDIE
jgi:hypothetical protein